MIKEEGETTFDVEIVVSASAISQDDVAEITKLFPGICLEIARRGKEDMAVRIAESESDAYSASEAVDAFFVQLESSNLPRFVQHGTLRIGCFHYLAESPIYSFSLNSRVIERISNYDLSVELEVYPCGDTKISNE